MTNNVNPNPNPGPVNRVFPQQQVQQQAVQQATATANIQEVLRQAGELLSKQGAPVTIHPDGRVEIAQSKSSMPESIIDRLMSGLNFPSLLSGGLFGGSSPSQMATDMMKQFNQIGQTAPKGQDGQPLEKTFGRMQTTNSPNSQSVTHESGYVYASPGFAQTVKPDIQQGGGVATATQPQTQVRPELAQAMQQAQATQNVQQPVAGNQPVTMIPGTGSSINTTAN